MKSAPADIKLDILQICNYHGCDINNILSNSELTLPKECLKCEFFNCEQFKTWHKTFAKQVMSLGNLSRIVIRRFLLQHTGCRQIHDIAHKLLLPKLVEDLICYDF